MKLEKYEDKNKEKRKVILISLGVIVLISISLLLYKTFASFTESAEFPIMNGKVDYFGNSDVYFAFYKGDEQLDEMPQKDNKENLVFDYGTCDNGATIEWNSEEWGPMVKNLSKSKTKCSIYFKEYEPNAADYIIELAKTDTTNLMADDTSEANIRYVGATVNNYIDIGDKDIDGQPILWRIIGVMNNITNLDNNGQQESLVKIIRAESIGEYSWDSSDELVNMGRGINEWSQADLMKLLNPEDVYSQIPIVGKSLYWNRANGYCFYTQNDEIKDCDFTSSGISEEAKEKIVKVRWNTGTKKLSVINETPKNMYESERSDINGKNCPTKNQRCNDDVERTTTWEGYIGLMYPSDFGYAVGGSVRETCLGKSMYSYKSDSCNTNDWLKPSGNTWTMTPQISEGEGGTMYVLFQNGYIEHTTCDSDREVLPVAYLKSSTKILPNPKSDKEYGSKENPFVLE